MTKQFPKFLGREDHFKCPIWMADARILKRIK